MVLPRMEEPPFRLVDRKIPKEGNECPASTTRQHQKSKSNVGPHTLQTTYKLQLKASCIPDIDSTTREFAPTLKPTIPFAIIKETMFSFTSHR